MISFRVLVCCLALFSVCSVVNAQDEATKSKVDLFLVHFELGPAWDKELSPPQQNQFAEHSKNLQRLRAEGRIKFGARYEDYGMIVLEAANLSTAQQELDNDPGVVAKIFRYRIAPLNIFFPWQP